MERKYKVLKPSDLGESKLRQEFASDVLIGLSHPHKRLSSKFIYNAKGSKLFCDIMELQEYYLTNCEAEILDIHKEQIANIIGKEFYNLIELGAGDGQKTKIILNNFSAKNHQFKYIPIDISEKAIHDLTSNLSQAYDKLNIFGLVSDYFDGIRWIADQDNDKNVVLFLGSNIGNFTPSNIEIFLSSLWNALNDGDYILIGFDLKKDIDLIKKAYNDSKGVTAQFNLNLLHRINEELGGNFDINKFQFYSTYDPFKGAIITSLVSTTSQTVFIKDLNRSFHFRSWEPVHTESSYKFSEFEISAIAEKMGFEIIDNFHDTKRYFVDSLWQVKKDVNPLKSK